MSLLPLINPIALTIGSIEIRWYGIILGLAALAGLLLAVREGKRFNIKPDFFMDLLLIGVPSAIIAARIYYVAFEWDVYKGNFYEMIAIWHGGIAIHGALIGAIIGAVIYTRVKKVNFWRIADIAAPSLIAGQMIGRWGNFVNQEAHGGPVEQSFLTDTLHIPNWIVNHMNIEGIYYHPTFLYESLWNFAGLLLLFLLRRGTFLRAGELFMSYFIWYSIGRFYIEGVRTDSLAFEGPQWLDAFMDALWAPMNIVFDPGALPFGGGNIRSAQFTSLVIIIVAVAFILWRRLRGGQPPRYQDPIMFGKPGSTIIEQDDQEIQKSQTGQAAGVSGAERDDDDVQQVKQSAAEPEARKASESKIPAETKPITAEVSVNTAAVEKPERGNTDSPNKTADSDAEDVQSASRIKPGNPFL